MTDTADQLLSRAIAEAMRAEIVPAIAAAIEQVLASRQSAMQVEFISVSEALRVLHVSRTQLYRLFERGELSPIKRGRATLLHRDDVRQFVERLRQEGRR